MTAEGNMLGAIARNKIEEKQPELLPVRVISLGSFPLVLRILVNISHQLINCIVFQPGLLAGGDEFLMDAVWHTDNAEAWVYLCVLHRKRTRTFYFPACKLTLTCFMRVLDD